MDYISLKKEYKSELDLRIIADWLHYALWLEEKIFDSSYTNDRWYPVPPYKDEGWRVMNEQGELVATFESKQDCMRCVKEINNSR